MFMRISTWDGDHQQRWAKSYDRPGACLNRPRLPTPFRRVVDSCVDDLSRLLRGKYLQDGGVYRPDADPAENFPLCFDSVQAELWGRPPEAGDASSPAGPSGSMRS
jgi:hypothetical protein